MDINLYKKIKKFYQAKGPCLKNSPKIQLLGGDDYSSKHHSSHRRGANIQSLTSGKCSNSKSWYFLLAISHSC